jgi:hypothetical protein
MTAHAAPRWTTAAFTDSVDTSPMELRALGAHVSRCNTSRSRWFQLRCAVDAVHDVIAPRIMTTLVVATAVIGTAVLVL